MNRNKLKGLLIATCYVVSTLWLEAQSAEKYNLIGDDHQSSLKSMTTMHFASMNIEDEAAKSIAIGIKYNTVLNYVDLNHNRITIEGIKYLALSLKGKPITQFHMHGSKIGDEGHVLLAEAIRTWPGLTHINLNETDLGDVGAEALADALKDKRNLCITYVNSGNKLSPEGTKKFFSKLANL